MATNSFKLARGLIHDLFEPKPWIYWTDFLITLTVAYGAAIALIEVPEKPLALSAAFYLVAIVGLYRLSLFIHEISHMGPHAVPGFRTTWNLLAGMPMLLPSFFYETHREHHNTHHYGTAQDGEYLPLARGRWRDIAAYALQIFYLPILTFVRHLVITPISFLHPRLRKWTLEHWSSFVINLRYRREIRPRDPVRAWALMEIACHLRAQSIIWLVVLGIDPWYAVPALYALAVGTLTLNHIRTLAAHRYRNDGRTMTLDEQMLDSTDIAARDPLTLALCPLGLRFHALHHWFPGMPYHNLGKAHRRLMAHLPADHPYRRCVYPSLWSVIAELVAEIKRHRVHFAEEALQKDWQHAS